MSKKQDINEIIVKMYADKDRRQYKITIPKKIVQLLDFKHGDSFELSLEEDYSINLKKLDHKGM